MNPQPEHLEPTSIIDSNHKAVQAFAHAHAGKKESVINCAVSLFYAVRDEIRYNPYLYDLSENALKASFTLKQKESWCVPKAILLAACCRAIGIPARLGFADVRNHLSTQRLREAMKTDLFSWHGYTLLFLGGKWVKATPAFNKTLCQKFRLATLEFDGEHNAIFHPFDLSGNAHMEYVWERGEYDDVPLEKMQESALRIYGSTRLEMDGEAFDGDVG